MVMHVLRTRVIQCGGVGCPLHSARMNVSEVAFVVSGRPHRNNHQMAQSRSCAPDASFYLRLSGDIPLYWPRL
jgi:hypothetical protein